MTTNSGIILPDNYEFFDAKLNYGLTQKQLEEQKRTAEFIQWGRRNPVLFAEQIFGISLMDIKNMYL